MRWRKADADLAELRQSVVLPADSSALASARSGTRSKNNPALPRITVRREGVGVHAKPTRGDTLFRVRIDRVEHLQVVAQPGVDGQRRMRLPLVLNVEPDVRVRLRDDGLAERLSETRRVVGAGEKIRER